ncbi:MAG: phenylacetate-CoA oxygenase/reductase subunit PaaK [Pseudomonadota bacterium]|nr:phenylacetate-CoA oxygenase/reductase subunit PaaK [Pseudomonadota bacterium]
MPRFFRLPVARVERETRDAVAITFAVPPELESTFQFQPGQHLTVRAVIDGEEVRRSYSICAGTHERRLRIAVKRNSGGLFSNWANGSIAVGDLLDVMPPLGHFHVPLDGKHRKHYVAFAAGSGITPVLSIVASTLASEPGSQFTLVYGNRASSTVMFREELAALKDVHLSRFNLLHILSREAQDIPLFHGRIDREKVTALLQRWIPVATIDTAFVCGPEGMMAEVKAGLLEAGLPEDRIRIERFATSVPMVRHVAPPVASESRTDCEVTVVLDGITRTFQLDRSKDSILDGGLKSGFELPYSCKSGVCSTCRAKLVHGEVDMDANYALEDYEVARGFVLTCQSYPVTDAVCVDYDQGSTGAS